MFRSSDEFGIRPGTNTRESRIVVVRKSGDLKSGLRERPGERPEPFGRVSKDPQPLVGTTLLLRVQLSVFTPLVIVPCCCGSLPRHFSIRCYGRLHMNQQGCLRLPRTRALQGHLRMIRAARRETSTYSSQGGEGARRGPPLTWPGGSWGVP